MLPTRRQPDPINDAEAVAGILADHGAVCAISRPHHQAHYITRTVQFAAHGDVRGSIFLKGKPHPDTKAVRLDAAVLVGTDEIDLGTRNPSGIIKKITTIIQQNSRPHVHLY